MIWVSYVLLRTGIVTISNRSQRGPSWAGCTWLCGSLCPGRLSRLGASLFFFFLAASTAYESSWARDQTHSPAATQSTAVAMLDLSLTVPQGNVLYYIPLGFADSLLHTCWSWPLY